MIKRAFLQFVMLFIMTISISGCNNKEENKYKNPSMNIDYMTIDGEECMVRDGTEQAFYQVQDNETYTFLIKVRKTYGTINILIFKDGNSADVIYEGNDIADSEFDVYAKEAGEYTVWIELNDFVGDYSVGNKN